ncbi:MAG TPA: ABC transporter permease [Polyangiaceae bacterium]|nr:ABC transporter permease [Polyangiaceae bacterium]
MLPRLFSGPPSDSPAARAWRRLLQNRAAVSSGIVLTLMVLGCVALPALLGLDPNATAPALRHQPPSAAHWFGTDAVGRDLFARVLVGGRVSLSIGLAATLVSVTIGVAYGAVAGFYGGKLDEILMRFVDFLYGLPYMFLVILIMLLFAESARGQVLPVFLALGLIQWLTMARIVRGQVMALRHRDFVLAAELSGASDVRILVHHMLPNILGVIVVYATLMVPSVIILESFLSFLGLGVALSWGQLVSAGVQVVNSVHSYWWLLAWPSLFLGITLLALNFLGDGLRDALDPKGRS